MNKTLGTVLGIGALFLVIAVIVGAFYVIIRCITELQ